MIKKISCYLFLLFLVMLFTGTSFPAMTDDGPKFHSNMCDASAAVAIGSTLFIVANDEDNILRIYQNNTNGDPIYSYDLTQFLEPDVKHPEADIEGATRIGDRVYWITSHGRNKNGKMRTSRHRLFATSIKRNKAHVTIKTIGMPYKNLIQDLLAAPQFKEFKLNIAAKRPPKDFGGLNIEGLCATPDSKLLIGFRNPIPDGKSLIIQLENPEKVIMGEKAKFGNPIKLSLENLGIRSIEYMPFKKKYLIVAGPYNGNGISKLFEWSGNSSSDPRHIKKVSFPGLNPEALIIYDSMESKIQILSDDGTKEVNGSKCKNAKIELRSFRSYWFNL